MVSEWICDLQGTNSDLCVNGYRCVLRGNVVDKTILENRRRFIDVFESGALPSSPLPQIVAT
jgi:hypothetical protein